MRLADRIESGKVHINEQTVGDDIYPAEPGYRYIDLAVRTGDGAYRFRGRLKRFLKAGGEMISLPAIEEPPIEPAAVAAVEPAAGASSDGALEAAARLAKASAPLYRQAARFYAEASDAEGAERMTALADDVVAVVRSEAS